MVPPTITSTRTCVYALRHLDACFYAVFVRLRWPLTGRREELAAVAAALDATDTAGIVVCGSAGVGKSRIVREALTSFEDRTVRWVVATSSARTLPLGAFASWADTGVTDNLQLVQAVIDSLTGTASDSAVVIGVDDAHLLDDLSAFVLHQIVLRGSGKVVLTVRDGESVPLALQDVWKVGHFDRLDVQPLSAGEVGALLSAALVGSVEPDSTQRLWRLTKGNPLFLRNIVEQEVESGRLARFGRMWCWTGDPVLPPGLMEVVDSRMGALPGDVSDVVDALAVGEPIELSTLRRITSDSAVEDADLRGLITVDDADTHIDVRLAHPLYGEVRRKRAAATRLRRLRGLLASELAGQADRDELRVLVRRATLSLDADLDPDCDLLARAAHGAAWQLDLPLATRLADAAVRAGGDADALFIQAFLLSWMDRGHEAESVLAEMSGRELSSSDRAKLLFIRAINRHFSLADPDGARELIEGAAGDASMPANGCVDAAHLVYTAAMGDPETALTAAARLESDALPDAAARMAAWATTVAAGDRGSTTAAITVAQGAYDIPIRGYLIILDAQVSAHVLAGQIADAQEAAATLRQRAADYPSPKIFPASEGVTGCALLGAGLLDEASVWLNRTDEMLTASSETIGWTYRFRLMRTVALAMRGLVDEAVAALAGVESCRHPGWRYLDYQLGLSRAWVAAARGLVTDALHMALEAAEIARNQGQFAAEVFCLQTAAQFGDGTCAERLDELECLVEGPRAHLAAQFARGLKSRDAVGLETLSRDYETMGDLIAAVDAASHAALIHRRAERQGSALTCTSRAESLARRSGAATPAFHAAAVPTPFTDREREIVRLIGEGLTTRAIAERLTLSVRTVEGHIYRAMAKSGAVDRDQLAAMLPAPRD